MGFLRVFGFIYCRFTFLLSCIIIQLPFIYCKLKSWPGSFLSFLQSMVLLLFVLCLAGLTGGFF